MNRLERTTVVNVASGTAVMAALALSGCAMPQQRVAVNHPVSQTQPIPEQQPAKNRVTPTEFAERIATQWPKLQVGQSMAEVKAIVSAIDGEFADTMSFAMMGMAAGYSMSDSTFRHVYEFADPAAVQSLVNAKLVASPVATTCKVEMKLMFDSTGKLTDWAPKPGSR